MEGWQTSVDRRAIKMVVEYADVEEQYRKNKDLKKEDVKMLQEWLEHQAHLPKLTELQIILFLYSCYNSNEATKKCIDNYYTARTHCPEFFAKRNPANAEIQNIMNVGIIAPMPNLTPEGHVVFYSRLIDTNPDVYDFNNGIKVFDMGASMYLQEMGALQGHIIIIDLMGSTLTHVLKTGVMSVKKYLFFLQEALPFRLKGFHFVNAVPFMDKILALIKPFMKKELTDMLQIHQSNSPTLFKAIPQNCLPEEIGGTGGSALEINKKFNKKIMENAQYFIDEEKMLVNESLRPGKPKNAGDLFGVEGTFKKLDID